MIRNPHTSVGNCLGAYIRVQGLGGLRVSGSVALLQGLMQGVTGLG